jgi:phenylacetate-CoA ligase
MLSGTFRNLLRLRRSMRWSHRRRNAERLTVLNDLIDSTRRNVPMYRALYQDVPDAPLQSLADLSNLPIVKKDDLRANFPDRVVNQTMNAETLYQVATSGTSDRVMTFQDDAKRDWDRAADLYVKYTTEGRGKVLTIPPDDCYERCGLNGTDTVPLTSTLLDAITKRGRDSQSARREAVTKIASRFLWNESVMPAPGIDGTAVSDATIDHYFDEILRLAPKTVRALPYYLWMFSKRANGRRLSPCETVRPSGGKGTPAMIAAIESNLGVKFRENYGTAELGSISIDGETPCNQMLLEHLFIIEFVRDGMPVPDGDYGEVLITDLRNRASPLIRYAVGDVGRVIQSPDPDDVIPLRFEIAGRKDETIISKSGVIAPPDIVIDIIISDTGLDYFKLVQQDDTKFLLEYVPMATPIKTELLERSLRTLLKTPEIKLSTRKVRRVAPESSGKYKLVISRSSERFGKEAPPC